MACVSPEVDRRTSWWRRGSRRPRWPVCRDRQVTPLVEGKGQGKDKGKGQNKDMGQGKG